MKKISAVIFDVGNVMVTWEPRAIYEPHFTDKAELDWFMDTVITMDWHKHHDAGRSFEDGVKIRAEAFPDYADLIALYKTDWDNSITGVIEGTIDCMRALKTKGMPLYGLTNFNGPQFARFRRHYDFIDLLDGVVVSGDEGIIKPDPAIYDLILSRYNLIAKETLFIDDSLENVLAAEKQGLIGHHFKGSAPLKQALEKLELL